MEKKKHKVHKDVQIGHVHLTVGDLDRAMAFYCDILGFEVSARYGTSAVFLSAGGYHHHIALNTWNGKGATPAPAGHTLASIMQLFSTLRAKSSQVPLYA